MRRYGKNWAMALVVSGLGAVALPAQDLAGMQSLSGDGGGGVAGGGGVGAAVGAPAGGGGGGGLDLGDTFRGAYDAVKPVGRIAAQTLAPTATAAWDAGRALAPQVMPRATEQYQRWAPHVQQALAGPQPGQPWSPFPGVDYQEGTTTIRGNDIPLPPKLREGLDPRVNPTLKIRNYPDVEGQAPGRFAVTGSGYLGYGGGREYLQHVMQNAGVQNADNYDQVMRAAQQSLQSLPPSQRRAALTVYGERGENGNPHIRSTMFNLGDVTGSEMRREVDGRPVGGLRYAPEGRMSMDFFGPTQVLGDFTNALARNTGAMDRQVQYREGIPISGGLDRISFDPTRNAAKLDISGGGGIRMLGYHGAGANVDVYAGLDQLPQGQIPVSGDWQPYRQHSTGPVLTWVANRVMDRKQVTQKTDQGIRQELSKAGQRIQESPFVESAQLQGTRNRKVRGNIQLALPQGVYLDGARVYPAARGQRSMTRVNASIDPVQAAQGFGRRLVQ